MVRKLFLSPVMNVEGMEGTYTKCSDILVSLSSYLGSFHRNLIFPDFLIHDFLPGNSKTIGVSIWHMQQELLTLWEHMSTLIVSNEVSIALVLYSCDLLFSLVCVVFFFGGGQCNVASVSFGIICFVLWESSILLWSLLTTLYYEYIHLVLLSLKICFRTDCRQFYPIVSHV